MVAQIYFNFFSALVFESNCFVVAGGIFYNDDDFNYLDVYYGYEEDGVRVCKVSGDNKLGQYMTVVYREYLYGSNPSEEIYKSFTIDLNDVVYNTQDTSFTYIGEEGFEITFEYELI